MWLPRKILSALLKCIFLFTWLTFSPIKNVIGVNVQSFERGAINRDALFTFAELCVTSFKISEILFLRSFMTRLLHVQFCEDMLGSTGYLNSVKM